MIDPATLERNARLVRARMLEQLESSLKKGSEYINQELEGPQNFLIRPVVRSFYDTFVKPILRDGSKGNLELDIECAKELILDPGKKLEEVIERNAGRYFKNDQTARFANKRNTNYRWFVENVKDTFKAQVKHMVEALKCEAPDVSTYDGLMIATYKTRENARAALQEQIQHMEMGIDKLQSDPSVMDIAVGKELITRVLVRGMKDTKAELLAGVDDVFKGK
ncbi:MAG: hypothetical protein JW839_19510 [Candidatus Lokiarchaeota archaeon]|nr:hypothetical protein [Candidatus Lokiarchaeota archaeon]